MNVSKRVCVCALAVSLALAAQHVSAAEGPSRELAAYRAELEACRKQFGGSRTLPDVRFFLFGMGPRVKLLYRGGELIDAVSGKVLRRWEVLSEEILPPAYCVRMRTTAGDVSLIEDEKAVWIEENGRKEALQGASKPVVLPSFADCRYPLVLRVLHQELLVNVIDGKPVPNYFVYRKPWYRDGAMMAMCFQATGNLDVVRDWIMKLRDPFDRNNAGETEADNLGQTLWLVSLVADKKHPAVERVLKELPRFEVSGPQGKFIRGRSDFAEHAAYQTKWLKYGLRALKLDDPYVIPNVAESYSALFWMDYKDSYVAGSDASDTGDYPYLGWACAHFHGKFSAPLSDRDYPLTWERNASQADYDGEAIVSKEYVRQRLSAPHTWHAAEAFLYLHQQKR